MTALHATRVALCAGLLASAPLAARAGYTEGQSVVVTGVVTDAGGVPLGDLTVTLEASRSSFDVRWLRRSQRDLVRFSATSNARGEFSLSFPWSGYYNRYELTAGVPVRKPGGETTQILERLDLSRRIAHGSPVVATLAVKDTRFLTSLREFLASVRTDDERRVYAEAGKPDAVDRVLDGPRVETTWWYYEMGKAYRFEDGRLAETESFDPVRAF